MAGDWRIRLRQGTVIPAHPLALNAERHLDERRQRGLTRYYLAAGAGGVAVGVHTTQFAIRDSQRGLFEPVLALAIEEFGTREAIRVAGICGTTGQATREAELAARLGYHAGLVSLAALRDAPLAAMVDHVRAVGEILPVIAFYLQPAVGGRVLEYRFWRAVAELECVIAVKIAPFNRYQTIDVVRAVAESGRADQIALYTGNDDNIVTDLLTPFEVGGRVLRIVGGLLGQWAVWTRKAVQMHRDVNPGMLALGTQLTDANAALFDAANHFHGCIAGLHEILRRQGLLCGRWCLDPHEDVSPGQIEEIDRVCRAYPHLTDDDFVAEHVDAWLK
jgi:dihydrodipicolinate synthase/N-acetylneuraminate lyase